MNFLEIGENVFFAVNVVINAAAEIKFEDETMVGIGSVIVSGNHSILNGSYRFGPRQTAPILVGRGSWIGANCVVTAGSVIPPHSLIAAGSVVTKKLDFSGVYGGVPAKIIRKSVND